MTLWTWALAVAALGQVSGGAPYSPTQGDPTFEGFVMALDNVPISAEVDGPLTKLPVREGSRVAADDLLATIDDREAQAAVEVAEIGLDAALKRADDKVEEDYARAAADVAEAALFKSREANRKNPNSVPETEVLRLALDARRAELQIEKAQKDQVLAGLDANVKKAELHAARVALERRLMRAPFDGEVQKMFVQEAQWVRAGDPILQLVRFDTLKVECFVSSHQYRPVDLANRKVTVRVQSTGGRELSFQGRVVFASQLIESDDFMVRAEIPNQRVGKYWLLQHGLLARMTVHLNEAAEDPDAAKVGMKP